MNYKKYSECYEDDNYLIHFWIDDENGKVVYDAWYYDDDEYGTNTSKEACKQYGLAE
jgi:hypothetical protein